jgi:hypothetical protein
MVALLLAAAALAAQAPSTGVQRPTGVSLVDCSLSQIDFERTGRRAPQHRFVLLLGAPQGERHEVAADQVRVFDPGNLLMGQHLGFAYFNEDPDMLFAQTAAQPDFFRLAISLRRLQGGIGMNGSGSVELHMAHSYMGDCTITEPADAAERFEALRSSQ